MSQSKPTLTDADIDLILNRLLLTLPSKEDVQAMEQRHEKKYDNTINLLDKVAGSLKAMQEELTMVFGHKDQLEEHEDRLAVIETQPNIASAI